MQPPLTGPQGNRRGDDGRGGVGVVENGALSSLRTRCLEWWAVAVKGLEFWAFKARTLMYHVAKRYFLFLSKSCPPE